LGNSVWMPLYLLMSGILMATTPKVAHRFGARKLHEIGPLVRQALWLALTVGVTAAVLLTQAEPLLRLMEVEESLIEPSMGYLVCRLLLAKKKTIERPPHNVKRRRAPTTAISTAPPAINRVAQMVITRPITTASNTH